MHLVITDSGLGGLGICAAIERAFRLSGHAGDVRLTYFNAWPEEGLGYNSLPDERARLARFESALARMSDLRPDRIIIACNTLSVLFPRTGFAQGSALPVVGIIDAGVDVFDEALRADRNASIALFGTRITMESGAHRDQLVRRGTSADRIVQVPCHGLAAAIEKDAASTEVEYLIDQCVSEAAAQMPPSGPVLAGLCCTHYGYVADRFRAGFERVSGRAVGILDPNGALVRLIARESASGGSKSAITVDVMSKVMLDGRTQAGIGRLVAPISPATASALQSYAHVPDLF